MLEAIQGLKTPRQLRVLFVHLLVNDCVPAPISFWETFSHHFALDFTLHNPNAPQGAINETLRELGKFLEEYGKELADYGLPQPMSLSLEVEHELHRWGSDWEALAEEADLMYASFNDEKKGIYDEVLDAVLSEQPLLLFVDGKAGRGKTYLVRAICNKIRSLGKIVIPTATSAFAAQGYAGGRTTHSAFKV